jgi:hypothetical protein
MAQPNSSIQHPCGGSWVAVGSARKAPRADPLASALLLIAGAIGIWQLLLPWRSAGVDITGSESGQASATGWQVYRLLHAVPDPTVDIRFAMYSVLGVAVGGGAFILLGLAMMLPINHRPLGLAALLLSTISILGACWLLVRSKTIFDVGLFGLFSQAQLGWYLFLAAGIVGGCGSWKALATG